MRGLYRSDKRIEAYDLEGNIADTQAKFRLTRSAAGNQHEILHLGDAYSSVQHDPSIPVISTSATKWICFPYHLRSSHHEKSFAFSFPDNFKVQPIGSTRNGIFH
jgi:hypothetical protein